MAATQMTPQPQPTASVQLPNVNPEQLVTDPVAWQQGFEARQAAYVQALMAQAGAPIVQQMSDMLAAQARNDARFKDVTEKYWPEVEGLVAQVPAHLRSAALYENAIKLVRGNHTEELIAAKAAQLAATQGASALEGASSASGASSGASAPDAAVWQKFESSELGKRLLATSGKAGILRAVAAMPGETLTSYADKIAGSKAEFDPNKPGQWHTPLGGR